MNLILAVCVRSKILITSSYALQKMIHSMSHNNSNIIQKLASCFGLKYKVKRSLLFCLLLMKKVFAFYYLENLLYMKVYCKRKRR